MLNLHAIARTAVTALHPEETVTLYQSAGQTNVQGVLAPAYAAAQTVRAQIQSAGADTLAHQDEASRTAVARKAYLFGPPETALAPAGLVRPLARGGDLFKRADGTWWLVTGIMEDFTASGWVCVTVTQQLAGPQGVEADDGN